MPEVSQVIGNAEKTDPASWTGDERHRNEVSDIMTAKTAPPCVERGRRGSHPRLSRGADRLRSPLHLLCHSLRTRPLPLGADGAKSSALHCRLSDKGFREIVLTGVDLTSYGADLCGALGLGKLVKSILRAAPNLERLRLSSIDCIEADEDLIDAFAHEPRLMPHLHLSLQSGDDLILKRMKRRHYRADAVRFCTELRRLRPEIVFGADLIAGFPTETDAMFENTLRAHCRLRPDASSCLSLFRAARNSRRENAARRAGGIIKARAKRLREAGDAALRAHLAAQTGKTFPVLTERGGTGRTEDFTRVQSGDVPPSQMIDVVIAGNDGKMLEVRVRILNFAARTGKAPRREDVREPYASNRIFLKCRCRGSNIRTHCTMRNGTGEGAAALSLGHSIAQSPYPARALPAPPRSK